MLSDDERSMLLEQLARERPTLAETFTHEASLRTPACGDQVTARLTLAPALKTKEISLAGHGCTVSMAAMTALSRISFGDLPSFWEALEGYTRAVNGDGELQGDLEPFAGIGRFPLRGACATLAWRAVAEAATSGQLSRP